MSGRAFHLTQDGSMMSESYFSTTFTHDWEAFRACIERKGTPKPVYHVELFLDAGVQEAVCRRLDPLEGRDADDPSIPYNWQRVNA